MMILEIMAGGLAGALMKPLSDPLSRRLLTKRNKSFEQTTKAFGLQLLISAALGAGVGYTFGFSLYSLYLLCLLYIGNVISTTDIQHRIIPNDMVFTLLGIRILFGLPALMGVGGFPKWNPLMSLAGLAVLGFIFFLPGLMGKSIGFGDIKLAMAMGFVAGLMPGLTAVALMGVLVLGYGVVQRQMPLLQYMRINFPMGPFLCSGLILALLLQ